MKSLSESEALNSTHAHDLLGKLRDFPVAIVEAIGSLQFAIKYGVGKSQ
jgi:hypothetical protein